MLRRAGATDVQLIVAFEAEVMDKKLYGKPLDNDGARSEIETNEYYLDVRDGRIVATGAFRRRENASAYLSNIAVHPEMRRRGLGRAMMRHLISCCDDVPTIDLAVHPENEPACSLYVSLGFVPTRRQENFFGDGEPRLIMVRSRRAVA